MITMTRDIAGGVTFTEGAPDVTLPDGRAAHMIGRWFLFEPGLQLELWTQLGLSIAADGTAPGNYLVAKPVADAQLDHAMAIIAKLSFGPRDVAVLTTPVDSTRMAARYTDAWGAVWKGRGREQAPILLVMTDGVDLRRLPEEQARSLYEELRRRFEAH